MSEFSKKYTPEAFEDGIYRDWEKSGKFKSRESRTGEQFFIPIPPPNVTGVLHLGHALTLTLEDIMVRYHRMRGDATLWVPGTDHAGIATQAKVEGMLASEGLTKEDIGREKFLEKVWEWKEKYGNTIQGQVRKMGASCDWTKERFTLDKGLSSQVSKAFVDLYNKGLIYKGEYMVNYSPALKTVLSDAEVDFKDELGKLYYITYFISGTDAEIVVATTRPETLLGDVAVAIHPKDKRYKKYLKLGKKLILPIVNKEIPLVGDEMVDQEFGTGAVKITPAHDPNDFEVAKRLDLPLDNVVLGKDSRMTEAAGIFAGQDFLTARDNIVELLKSKGNLLKVEDYNHRVGYCSRSGCKIETIISKQWFVKAEEISKKVIKGYKKNEFEIIPSRFNKIFEDWIFNLRDWCISRQLWWGHQIPVWYDNEGNVYCAENEEKALKIAIEKTGNNNIELTRDNDVLDTWFSSALWPFSILDCDLDLDINSDKQSDLFKQFYPAAMLETGHDIIFFWVIRMLLFGYEFTNQTPFKQIYLHGLVKDKTGKKMSKSLGNGIDPLDVIKEYGTDALRLTLSIGNTPGNDLKFDIANVENNKIFINKLWNASRFVDSTISEGKNRDVKVIEDNIIKNYDSLAFHEKWILSRIKHLSDLVTKSMIDNSFSDGGHELQKFTKNEFCDYYIEEFKLTKDDSIYGEDVILYVINHLLKLWHPYIPFVSSELFSKIGFSGDLIIEEWSDIGIERNIQIEKDKLLIIDLIREVRSIRADNNIMPNKTIKLIIKSSKKYIDLLNENSDLIGGIVKSEETVITDKKPEEDIYSYGVIKAGVEVFIDTSNAIDKDKEIIKLKEQINDTKEYIAILDKKLLNEAFVNKAPEKLVRIEIDKKESAKDKLLKLEEKIGKLL